MTTIPVTTIKSVRIPVLNIWIHRAKVERVTVPGIEEISRWIDAEEAAL